MLLKWFSKSKCHLQMISILSTAGALTTTVVERQLNMVILDRTLRSDEQRTQNLPNIEYWVFRTNVNSHFGQRERTF